VAGWPARHDNCAAIRDVTARVLTRGHTSVAYLGYIPRASGMSNGNPVVRTP